MSYGLPLAMSRGERPRKVSHHWIQAVVAENIREAMEKDPLQRSPAKLGQEAGVGRKSVERLRDGKNSTLTTLGAVADALGVDPIHLVRKRTEARSGTPSPIKPFPSYPKIMDNQPTKSERKVRDRKKLTR